MIDYLKIYQREDYYSVLYNYIDLGTYNSNVFMSGLNKMNHQ
ncbi:MAG: hypothetical protein K0S47_1039 [Herbinix sp.]|jgi:hypothetical protein|nr:hypothetical protein [Herbinix sp.]